MLSIYTDKYPGKELAELLSLVALTESRGRLSLMRKIEAMGKEVEMLEKQTDTYLENIDNQPPATTR